MQHRLKHLYREAGRDPEAVIVAIVNRGQTVLSSHNRCGLLTVQCQRLVSCCVFRRGSVVPTREVGGGLQWACCNGLYKCAGLALLATETGLCSLSRFLGDFVLVKHVPFLFLYCCALRAPSPEWIQISHPYVFIALIASSESVLPRLRWRNMLLFAPLPLYGDNSLVLIVWHSPQRVRRPKACLPRAP